MVGNDFGVSPLSKESNDEPWATRTQPFRGPGATAAGAYFAEDFPAPDPVPSAAFFSASNRVFTVDA